SVPVVSSNYPVPTPSPNPVLSQHCNITASYPDPVPDFLGNLTSTELYHSLMTMVHVSSGTAQTSKTFTAPDLNKFNLIANYSVRASYLRTELLTDIWEFVKADETVFYDSIQAQCDEGSWLTVTFDESTANQ
ncbi:hypothetical protein HDV03_000692, partial [Kappamyces sp. JEL0829]